VKSSDFTKDGMVLGAKRYLGEDIIKRGLKGREHTILVNRDVNTLSGGGCHHPSVLVTRGGRGPCMRQASRGYQGKEGVGNANFPR
jgi:hypothetical protein